MASVFDDLLDRRVERALRRAVDGWLRPPALRELRGIASLVRPGVSAGDLMPEGDDAA